MTSPSSHNSPKSPIDGTNLPANPSSKPPPDSKTFERAPDVVRSYFDRGVVRVAKVVAWLVFIAMAISVYEVIMRYGFGAPTSWVHETVVMLVAVSFCLGGPATLASNRHIRVKVLYDAVGPRFRLWLDRFNDLVTFAFCMGMTYAAWLMFYSASHNPLGALQLERSGTSWNPPFPALVKGMILSAVAIMCIQALIHLIQSIRGEPAPDAPEGGAD
ncbi:TRAP transporter small permease subunit [Cobetia amphilecti]|uniref:TRAP transporter small permease protein n=1 Tax=Cobetia amphilecti TaxID=1055104 RepID=A0ABT6UT20_9GAMM|nr:TRAP transporter small permease [Cobetia amphilecti]MDI5885860.1 TRAP transporter small permease [Cobetia amphilecti]WOI27390.1 TRAP transporter small permease [Cobetia amphilecti]|tara:strand:+ start:6906 stop:7553 length:648 start_codon:yes stop_codon:yes gene_type:complete